ncbi:MAG: transcription elongation factor GreA [Firmicutes bacterium]|nr:transcription elongation factor GreA [Bacillota bacterium]
MANKTIYLTEQGLEELTKELEELKTVKRAEVIQALKEARALGDLSENAEYDAARNEQAIVEGRIKELEIMIENVEIISGESNGKVNIGATVSLSYIGDEEEEEYQIVGSQEADPFQNRISNESPLAQALLGHKKGDVVTVDSPTGEYDVEILDVK